MSRVHYSPRIAFILVVIVSFFIAIQVDSADLPQTQSEQTQRTPDWLEPMGINLATLTGLIPEADLRDSVIYWRPGHGIVTYDSGVVRGNNIEVTVRYDVTDKSEVWCLGEPPQLDHSGSVQPPSTMRVFSNGTDVTSRIQSSFNYIQAGQIQPTGGASTHISRYPQLDGTVQRSGGAIVVPANKGCEFRLNAALPNVTAVFTMARQDNISITRVYKHVNTNIHSYIGGGAAGNFAGLQQQMNSTYPHRHDPVVNWYDLTDGQKAAIDSSDYVFVKSPPSSHDPYGGTSGIHGTYRIAFNTGRYEWLSVDHVSAKLLPRLGNWRDADTQGNQRFLDYFQGMWSHGANIYENFDSIKSAEIFLPPGLDYQPCMTAGNCPGSLLDRIYNHTYTVEVFFYKVERIKDGGLEQVPLLSVGNGYSTLVVTNDAVEEVAEGQANAKSLNNHKVYLPLVIAPAPPPPDDNPAGCPGGCGWFDEHGQMLDFVPPFSWSFP